MLKIRLKRIGRRGQPHYRIVVMESDQPRDGEAIEEIGYYNPRKDPSVFDLDKDRAEYWLQNGAQPTETVGHYLVKEGLLDSLSKGSTPPSTKKGSKKEQKE